MNPVSTKESASARLQRDQDTVNTIEHAAKAAGRERQDLLDAAVERNLEMAYRLASRYFRRGMSDEDLRQVACLALVKAVHRFDPAKGERFAPFAILTIRGELRRHFRDTGWAVRPPRRVQELRAQVRDTEVSLTRRLNRLPTTEEVAAAVGAGAADVREAKNLSSCFEPMSIDAATSPHSHQTIGDRLGATDLDFSAVEARVMLSPLLASLPPRERQLIKFRFVDQLTQQEIGDRLGISQMQVSRRLTEVYARLRAALGDTARTVA